MKRCMIMSISCWITDMTGNSTWRQPDVWKDIKRVFKWFQTSKHDWMFFFVCYPAYRLECVISIAKWSGVRSTWPQPFVILRRWNWALLATFVASGTCRAALWYRPNMADAWKRGTLQIHAHVFHTLVIVLLTVSCKFNISNTLTCCGRRSRCSLSISLPHTKSAQSITKTYSLFYSVVLHSPQGGKSISLNK